MMCSLTNKFLTATALSLLLAGSVSATEIGSVSAANKRIDGTPPGSDTRILELGNRVFADEVIVSSEIGSGQFVFLDQTTLTVSPGSEIVLDRYIFDPNTGSGEIALTLTKGVLRFIGGKVTKEGEAIVMTPHATIGIRGGIAAITVGEEGTNAVFFAGLNMCVSASLKKLCVTRPGGMATVKAVRSDGDASGGTGSAGSSEPSGGEPVYVGVASPEQIGDIFQASNTGGDGGTTQTMEPQIVASASTSSGLQNVGAEAPGASTEQPVSTKGEEPQPEAEETPGETTNETRSEPETATASEPPETIVDDFMGGIKSDISTLGTSGEAIFIGPAVATITEMTEGGTTTFDDSGSFQLTYDFGDRSGAASISGIVDTTFISTVSEAMAPGTEHLGGTLRDVSNNLADVGSLSGSFFTDGTDPASSVVGNFDFSREIQGGTQTGAGSFDADNVSQ